MIQLPKCINRHREYLEQNTESNELSARGLDHESDRERERDYSTDDKCPVVILGIRVLRAMALFFSFLFLVKEMAD